MIPFRRKRSAFGVGHDAFLDIVANLVGVLIILIVVLGSSSTAMIKDIQQRVREEAIAESESEVTEEQIAELTRNSSRAAAAQADSDRLEMMIKRYDAEVAHRKMERATLLDLHTQATAFWEEKKQELDEQTTAQARRQTDLVAAQEELVKLEGERKRLESVPRKILALQHLPTPMAKTVFEERVSFRLRNNHLSVVPTDALIKAAFEHAERSAKTGKIIENDTIGPIRGYLARYSMEVRGPMARFYGAVFQPVSEPIGQPIEEVLAGGSELDIELAGREPGSTSILVWVYPDSYRSLRKLKEYLYARVCDRRTTKGNASADRSFG